MNKKNFSPSTISQIINKYTDKYGTIKCGACDRADRPLEVIPHHIFFKSQLFRPCVSMAENGVIICMKCHRLVHHGSNDEETTIGKEIDKMLKARAIAEFNGIIPEQDYEELKSIYRGRGYGLIQSVDNQLDGIL